MDVTSIIVLGGTSRISAEVAAEAQDLAGATELVRLAGADRYETSVQMAQQLGGWWPTGDAADFDSSMVCLAASGGNGASATGWPDALGAGPFCGAIGGAASNPGVPYQFVFGIWQCQQTFALGSGQNDMGRVDLFTIVGIEYKLWFPGGDAGLHHTVDDLPFGINANEFM